MQTKMLSFALARYSPGVIPQTWAATTGMLPLSPSGMYFVYSTALAASSADLIHGTTMP